MEQCPFISTSAIAAVPRPPSEHPLRDRQASVSLRSSPAHSSTTHSSPSWVSDSSSSFRTRFRPSTAERAMAARQGARGKAGAGVVLAVCTRCALAGVMCFVLLLAGSSSAFSRYPRAEVSLITAGAAAQSTRLPLVLVLSSPFLSSCS